MSAASCRCLQCLNPFMWSTCVRRRWPFELVQLKFQACPHIWTFFDKPLLRGAVFGTFTLRKLECFKQAGSWCCASTAGSVHCARDVGTLDLCGSYPSTASPSTPKQNWLGSCGTTLHLAKHYQVGLSTSLSLLDVHLLVIALFFLRHSKTAGGRIKQHQRDVINQLALLRLSVLFRNPVQFRIETTHLKAFPSGLISFHHVVKRCQEQEVCSMLSV